MSYSNGEIYGNVSINDIQRAIGSSSPDLGTLIRTGNINKWARYKPVSYPGVDKVRSRDIRSHSLPFTPDTVFDAKTGLNIGIMTSTPSNVAAWDDVEITYERPNGGIAQPYRMTDFSGYNNYAQRPVEFVWKNSFKKDQMMYCTVSIYDRSSADEQSYISFSDIATESFGNNTWKRLCMAVYDVAVSDTAPSFYFFSEKFKEVGSMNTISVSCTLRNTAFAQWLQEGHTYKFLTMLVTNHSYLEDIVSGDRERWEYGISASEMASIETGAQGIRAMCLAIENGIDRCERVLQAASIITDVSYYLDFLEVYKFGNIVYVGNYAKLCTAILLPAIIVRTLQQLGGSSQYQMRVSFHQGSQTSTEIFRPTDKSGNDYYAIQSYTSTSLPETPLTPWVTVNDIGSEGHSTETDPQGRTVHVYEFDFPNRTYTITSNSDVQTLGQSGLFLFFDQINDFWLTFTLYYRDSNTGPETLIKTIDLHYYIADGSGHVNDISW